MLLDRGAEVNAKAKAGLTPLVWAIPVLPPVSGLHERFAPDALEKITILLDRGADINARYGIGYTPLIRAACDGNLRIIRLLLKRGSDVKLGDNEGHTARWWAVCLHHEEAAKIIDEADGGTNQSGHQRHPRTQ